MLYLLRDRHVLLCVGGGIAAYKTADLIRRMIASGAQVQVAMTKAACSFITPLTLQTLSRRRPATDLLDSDEDASIGHIRLAEEAEVLLIAPATANLIARLAAGMANDVVTAAVLATDAPVVVAPAMNTNMLEHRATRANLERLAGFGYRIVEPEAGELACGWEGRGRLPDPEVLLEEIAAALSPGDLAGRRVLVSAGPTREALDPVRYLSNRSSGRMGYAVAAAAWRRGGIVTLVSGPSALRAVRGCEIVKVETAAEMSKAMCSRAAAADLVVMVAAVADYRAAQVADRKIKKNEKTLSLNMEKTEDVLELLSQTPGNRILVGFAAETEDVEHNAAQKLRRKNLDLIVGNDVTVSGGGFDSDTNAAILLDRQGGRLETGMVGKDELADRILDRAGELAGWR